MSQHAVLQTRSCECDGSLPMHLATAYAPLNPVFREIHGTSAVYVARRGMSFTLYHDCDADGEGELRVVCTLFGGAQTPGANKAHRFQALLPAAVAEHKALCDCHSTMIAHRKNVAQMTS